MQCASYIPLYYHARDLNVGANGYSWHLFNSNANYVEERGYNISLPPCNMVQYLDYDKEVMRQIIQNHEATFRYQVQELHRLYRRQRELMDEMRVREIFAQQLLSKTSESIHCVSHAWPDISQTTSHATSGLLGNYSHKLSELTAENILCPSNFVSDNFQEHTILCPGTSIRENSYDEVKFLSSRSQGNENRILDLELPADVYHDDEGKQFKEGILSKAPELTCDAPKKLPNIQPTSDLEIGSAKSGAFSIFNLNSQKTSCLIDLNEPIQFESLPSNSTGPFETHTCHMEIMYNDPCFSVGAIPESAVPKHSGLLNSDGSLDGASLLVGIDLNSVPVGGFPQTEVTLENLKTMSEGKCGEDNLVADAKIEDQFLKTETHIDLNTDVDLDEPSPPLSCSIVCMKSAGDMDLKGPLSPENEESSPPRGQSEDIQLDVSPLSSEQAEGEPSMKPEIIAAQILVNFRNHLCWFAEIVSSSGDDLEYELVKLQNDTADNDLGELLSHRMDDLGAITPKVSEEIGLNLSHLVRKEKETGNLSRKVHTRGKRQRKDLKTEDLPSLPSLSKDVHIIEGFPETGSSRRNAGKKACAKPRKYSKLSFPDGVKKSMSSILKQPASHSKHGVPQGWGKMRKRQGGRRCRATKFLVIS